MTGLTVLCAVLAVVIGVGVVGHAWWSSRGRGVRLGSAALLRKHGLDARGAVKRARRESPVLYGRLTQKRPHLSGGVEERDHTA